MLNSPTEVDSTASESTYILALGRHLFFTTWFSGEIWRARYEACAAASGGSENVGEGLLIKQGFAKNGIILGRTPANVVKDLASQYLKHSLEVHKYLLTLFQWNCFVDTESIWLYQGAYTIHAAMEDATSNG